jgi:hypothetical protein
MGMKEMRHGSLKAPDLGRKKKQWNGIYRSKFFEYVGLKAPALVAIDDDGEMS